MPNNYWSDNESADELDPLSSLLSEFTDPEDEEEEFRSDFFQGLEGRRRKAAFVLMLIWAITLGLHLVPWGLWVVRGLMAILVFHKLQ
jgi:1,2-diacylglycerol 3-beta-glucosyltransferase